MNKRVLRFSLIIVLIISLCAGVFGTVKVSADNEAHYQVIIEDGAGLLTASQKEKLREEMLLTAEYANVAFVTTNDNPYYTSYATAEKDAKQYAEAYFMRVFGNGTNGVVFLIDMEARVIWIASDGKAYTRVNGGRANSITDNAYNYASKGDYYGCAVEVFREVRTVLAGGRVVIEDGAGLFSVSEKEGLREMMLLAAEYANVALVTTKDNPYYYSYSTAETAAKQYAESFFISTFGNGTNGVVFLIDMESRVIWIASAGEAYNHVTDARAESITDNVYKYASNRDYYGCALEAFREIRTVLEGGVIPEPMKIASNVLLAIAASMLVMFFIVQGVMNPKKASAGELKAASFVTFEGSQPVVYHTGQTRRYDPPAKSSGGGGGGHSGGGGGGFSGGGGGHRF